MDEEREIAYQLALAIASSFNEIEESIAFEAIEIIYNSMLNTNFKTEEKDACKNNQKNCESSLQERMCHKKLFGEELQETTERLFEGIEITSIHIAKKGGTIEVSFE